MPATILRKTSCPCGGGCPGCQSQSGGLRVSQPTDASEMEADRLADRVMRMPAGDSPAAAAPPAGIGASAVPRITGSGGSELDPASRSFFEPRFGTDLGHVRVHSDVTANDSARALNARAYAFNNSIVFDAGEYRPDSYAGKRLLAHEIAHVLQQSRGGSNLISRQDRDTAETVDPSSPATSPESSTEAAAPTAPASIPARGQMYVSQTPDGLWYYFFNPEDVREWSARIEQFVIIHLNAAFVGVTDSVVREFLALEHRFVLTPHDPEHPDVPLDRAVPVSINTVLHNGILEWLTRRHPEISERSLRTGVREIPPAATRAERGSREREDREREATVPAAPTSDRQTTPVHADLSVMAENPALSQMWLIMMQHFTSLPLSDANRALASDGLTAEELAGLISDDALRRVLTDLFTQGWSEFVNAGGSNVDAFGSLIERILEQFTRGSTTATANRLRIGHGIPETEILGIVHRNSGILLYDELGNPLRWNLAPRDLGYLGIALSEADTRAGMASDVTPMTHREEVDRDVANLFAMAMGAQETAVAAQAAQAWMRHIETVSARMRAGLPTDAATAVAETLVVMSGFLIGHAFTAYAMRSLNPYLFTTGVLVEGLLRGAGYVMGIDFASDVAELLHVSGFHMSRVRDDEAGNPTALSEYHLNMAAEPIRQLIIDTFVFMGGGVFGRAARSATVRGAALRWTRVSATAFMLGLADAIPATRGTGGGPGPLGARGAPMLDAPAAIEAPLLPESETFIDPARPPPVGETAPVPEAAPTVPAPVVEAPPPRAATTAPIPVTEPAPPPEAATTSPVPTAEPASPLEPATTAPTPATTPAPSATASAMEAALIDSFLADPAGLARRRARLEQLRQLIDLLRHDPAALRVHRASAEGRAALAEVVAMYERLRTELAALPPEVVPAETAPSATPEVATETTPETTPETVEEAAPGEPAASAEIEAEPATVAGTPRVLNPGERVSVNPAGTIYYPEGTRYFGHAEPGWTESTVAEADARGARRTRLPETRPRIPSGVLSVERPPLGAPRVVLRAELGFREARAGLERHMARAGEYALDVIRGWQRAHASGAGLGAESGEAIRLAPEFVNQILQNRGIEQFLRDLRNHVLPEGGRVRVTTVVETHPGTLRLAAIEYRIEVATEAGTSPLGDVRIEVSPEGNAQGFVRRAGTDTYEATPLFDPRGESVR